VLREVEAEQTQVGADLRVVYMWGEGYSNACIYIYIHNMYIYAYTHIHVCIYMYI